MKKTYGARALERKCPKRGRPAQTSSDPMGTAMKKILPLVGAHASNAKRLYPRGGAGEMEPPIYRS